MFYNHTRSPSRSPAPSPPLLYYNNNGHPPPPNPNQQGLPGQGGQGGPGAAGPPNHNHQQSGSVPPNAQGFPQPNGLPMTASRYQQTLISKLQQHQAQHFSHGPPHHHHHHSFSYPGPQPPSPAYPQISNGPGGHQSHPHQAHHSPHTINHPGPLGPPHNPAQPPPPPSQPLTPHWAEQLDLAQLTRQASSPHHHARQAHLESRSSGISISDPNKGVRPPSLVNGVQSYHHRKDGSLSTTRLSSSSGGSQMNGEELGLRSSLGSTPRRAIKRDKEREEEAENWTKIDMGGMNLKKLGPELFRYSFLTTLYVPHNNLTSIPPCVSSLVNLVHLDASSNKLISLPPEMGMLTQLSDLFVFDNLLTSLPPELGTLYNLDRIGIEGNPLPETLRSLLEKEGTQSLIAFLRDSCPVAPPPPERDWITIETDSFPSINASNPDAPPPETFSILCYNILCDKAATSHMYGYTPSWALSWDYRKELILQEVMGYGADILCLQEVDMEQYEKYFLPHLSQQDYECVYFPKSRARTMTSDEKRHVDGCATFYKSSTFSLVEQRLIEFNQIAMRRPDFQKTDDMFNRVMTKDNIAVVALLEHRLSGARLIVANAHIYWDPEFKDVKLVQVAMLMDELQKIADQFAKLPPKLNLGEGYDKAPNYSDGTKIPTIVCGDYNSVPDSGVYEFLHRGSFGRDHPDFMSHLYGTYTSQGASHRLSLKSAYSHVNELPFTNYTPGFQGVIDYIWYTANSMSVTGLLGEIDPTYVNKVVGFPNSHNGSDHIPIVAELKLKRK